MAGFLSSLNNSAIKESMNFFKHPSKVCMTYLEHSRLSCGLSCLFACASCKACVHAVYPDCYVKSSTDAVQKARDIMATAGCHEDNESDLEDVVL